MKKVKPTPPAPKVTFDEPIPEDVHSDDEEGEKAKSGDGKDSAAANEDGASEESGGQEKKD